MVVMLVQLDGLLPPRHGGGRAMRTAMEALARRGHTCHVLMPFDTTRRPEGGAHRPQAVADVKARGIAVEQTPSGTVRFSHAGVRYGGTLAETDRFYNHVWLAIDRVEPDVVIVTDSEGDYSRALLATVIDAAPGRVHFRAQTVNSLPFGPYATVIDPAMSGLLSQAAGVSVNSDYLRAYVWKWAGIEATTSLLPVYGDVAPPAGGEGRFVTMINPCRLKGLSIFVALAERHVDVSFAAVPSWGTTGDDRAALDRLPNVTLLPEQDGIDTILASSRAVLVPSVWPEAFGLVAVEAMLRGVPVLASDVGGLPEAKLGVDYLLPVRPIRLERGDPLPDGRVPSTRHEPRQVVDPWSAALVELLFDPGRYRALARESRLTAAHYVAGLDWSHFEDVLRRRSAAPV